MQRFFAKDPNQAALADDYVPVVLLGQGGLR